jgi:DNA (cytosine-5)-methyltransferase 1
VPSLSAVSLFSNCGAGDLGYRNAGFEFRVMAEISSRRLKVAGGNHPGVALVEGDLAATWPRVVEAYRKARGNETLQLLAACPPCQGMSSARGGRGSGLDPDAGSRDGRNLLVLPIARVARALTPRIVVVENVPAFLTRQVRDPISGKGVSAACLLINELKADYHVFPLLADLAGFGVPQSRKRAFLTFVRRGDPSVRLLETRSRSPYPAATHSEDNQRRRPISLEVALRRLGLPALDAATKERAAYTRLPLHCVPVYGKERYAMVAAIPPRSGSSAWEVKQCPKCGAVDVGERDALCSRCGSPLLRPLVRARNGTYRLIRGRSTSYRRMSPNRPAATVTTASGHLGSDLTIHPWENRVLSPLECADLQTIPRSFEWGDALEKWGHTSVREMIGEAVPPHFTFRHGRVLRSLLTGRPKAILMRRVDRRCVKAWEKLGLAGMNEERERSIK